MTMTTSRRRMLQATGAAIGSGAITGFPTIWAQNIKNVTLRQFGTVVSNLNAVAEKVKQDLGFTLQMTALDTDAVTQRAVTQPNSFDIADIEYFVCKKVFPAGTLQPMDTKKIKYFDKIVPIFITGKLTPAGEDYLREAAAGRGPRPSYALLAKKHRRMPPPPNPADMGPVVKAEAMRSCLVGGQRRREFERFQAAEAELAVAWVRGDVVLARKPSPRMSAFNERMKAFAGDPDAAHPAY